MEIVLPVISNKSIIMGVQSVSDELLKKIHRGHSFSDVENAIQLFEEFNYKIDIDLIFSLPGETKDDEELMVKFLTDINQGKYSCVKIHGHVFTPLPGTPFSKEPRGIVSKNLQKILGKLAKTGKAYGNWLYY